MFKAENFTSHIQYLFKLVLISFILSCITLIIPYLFDNPNISLFISVLQYGIPLIISLALTGYFWELTENVINRKTDIIASNVYQKNSFKHILTIELPELNFRKFLWRGFASIVATIIFLYPLVMLILFSLFGAGLSGNFNIDTVMAYIGCYIFIGYLVPALLWNYAYRNSVFSMINIPKAVHIIGTYPFKYTVNVFILLIFVAIQYIISISLGMVFGISAAALKSGMSFFSILYTFITSLFYIYWIYVNAYLIGTIVPADEA